MGIDLIFLRLNRRYMQEYDHLSVEAKWRDHWQALQLYRVSEDPDKPKFYVLDMFPYPSGAGLHVGHPLGYIASDIYARYKRLNGFNVLHPMGFDAFGLPAEQYALQTGIHPAQSTHKNMERYRQQLSRLGFSFDWSREVITCDADYYRWTQWIFIQLFQHYYDAGQDKALPIADLIKHFEQHGNSVLKTASAYRGHFSAGDWQAWSEKQRSDVLMDYRLAYRRVGYVNWCEALGTVLANDQIKDGVSERGGHPVEKRAMTQWYLRITAYAHRLLADLDQLEWSEALKTMQSNWIGRSEGATVFFPIVGGDTTIEIYTTRPDTIFGATFMVLAPEHPLVDEITSAGQRPDVEKYRQWVKLRSERDRQSDVKRVTGANTGAFAFNPFTRQHMPIWIAEYVLMDYGTGAIMAVPSDDERDQRFAQKFGLDIVDVVDKSAYPGATLHDKAGRMINSGFITGMEVPDAIEAVIVKLEADGLGWRRINYKMRDANFSRQRYWGEPFPVIFDQDDIAHAVSEEQLPVTLPHSDDFHPTKDGRSPLAKLTEWVHLPDGSRRETDTMPAVAGSSWYYLRYMDPKNDRHFASPEAINYWQDVDLYIGGAEHAVSHLLYSRFWHKFLYDLGQVPTAEPFRKLINQGMIQGVIETIYLQKEKTNEASRFVGANMTSELEGREFARIPVPIEFVTEYGTENSFLSQEGVSQFIAWSPEYADAIFDTPEGRLHKGVFTPRDDRADFRMETHSEVGKMSKSKYNVINPDDVIDRYGTDCFRLYEMFLGPLENHKPWDTKGIDGVYRFIKKMWRLFYDENGNWAVTNEAATAEELRLLHTTIKRVREDIERYSFNTCVSHLMILVNDLRSARCHKRDILEPLCVLIAPFAPYLSEELYQRFGYDHSVHTGTFPEYHESYLRASSVLMPISINGKKRAEESFAVDATDEEMRQKALTHAQIQKWTEGKDIAKIIIVPQKMINIVVR